MIDRKIGASAVLLLVLAACGGEAAKTDASGSPKGSAAPSGGDKPKGAATKLKKAETEAMLDKTFGMERMKEPIDKRVAEVEGKLGAPAKTDGGNGVWYMTDDAGACYELKLGKKDGAYTTSSTDKANCGL